MVSSSILNNALHVNRRGIFGGKTSTGSATTTCADGGSSSSDSTTGASRSTDESHTGVGGGCDAVVEAAVEAAPTTAPPILHQEDQCTETAEHPPSPVLPIQASPQASPASRSESSESSHHSSSSPCPLAQPPPLRRIRNRRGNLGQRVQHCLARPRTLAHKQPVDGWLAQCVRLHPSVTRSAI